jgi:YidC/Oxa1 family membrane protein insertase
MMISAGLIVAGITTPIVNVLAGIIDFLGPHGAIGLPWAWAIVALTVVVRIVLVPLTVKQIHSMQNLQRHAPEMKEIQRKYKGDRQKMNEELMKFYKENRINPAASCLPILLQIPIFISLFFLLKSFTDNVDYCGPPECVPGDNLEWLGLINILDKANVGWGPLLLVIYLASQLASTYFMSATMERTQRLIFFALPFLFIPFIINFKSGLVLYWATTNLWTVGQGVVTRRLVPRTKVAPQKKSSRTPPKAATAKAAVADDASSEPEPAEVAQATPATPRRVKRKKKRGGRR